MCSCQQSARFGCTADMITGFKFTETRQKQNTTYLEGLIVDVIEATRFNFITFPFNVHIYIYLRNIATKSLLFYAIELCIFYWPFERWEKKSTDFDCAIYQHVSFFCVFVSL